MNKPACAPRRVPVCRAAGLAVALLCAAAAPLLVQAAGEPPAAAASGASQADADKARAATLLVRVTGGGKPIGQADVQLQPGAKTGGVATKQFTNAAGEALLSVAATGAASVRVIVPGWKTMLRPVTLKTGKQTLEIALEALKPLPAGASAPAV